jgi:hypothetical protein
VPYRNQYSVSDGKITSVLLGSTVESPSTTISFSGSSFPTSLLFDDNGVVIYP